MSLFRDRQIRKAVVEFQQTGTAEIIKVTDKSLYTIEQTK